jgi:predicted phage terminase large subunit-like protein
MARRVRFWDLAATATPESDFSVGVKMAREGSLYYIEDVVRGRWTPHDRDAVILQTAHLDGRATQIVIEQEPGSSGVSQVAAMVQMLAGFRVAGKRSTGDKITRAGPLASQMEAGNVKLLSGAWVGPFIDELCSFPSAGVHDDQVDSAASAFLVLAEPALNPLAGMHVGIGVKGGWLPR